MEKQNIDHIDNNIHKVFHFLELKGVHHYLIGSNTMKGILYANDYDVNQDISLNDTVQVLNNIYKQFVHIFDTAYKNKNYYITDFKNGIHNHKSIKWSYEDVKKGYLTYEKQLRKFEFHKIYNIFL